jgi:hypothetical protein
MLSLIALPVIFLMTKNKSLPPSSAGNGSKFTIARFKLMRATRNRSGLMPILAVSSTI